jgi:hypothetical protein
MPIGIAALDTDFATQNRENLFVDVRWEKNEGFHQCAASRQARKHFTRDSE